mmetsp:Transcript_44369/g.116574  ORF Transcript_44369/g.116574 Transcript_44369/m.116574 type:complete len:251 (-) Transcript_44369:15-767(-)
MHSVRDAADEWIVCVSKVSELVQDALTRHEVAKMPPNPIGGGIALSAFCQLAQLKVGTHVLLEPARSRTKEHTACPRRVSRRAALAVNKVAQPRRDAPWECDVAHSVHVKQFVKVAHMNQSVVVSRLGESPLDHGLQHSHDEPALLHLKKPCALEICVVHMAAGDHALTQLCRERHVNELHAVALNLLVCQSIADVERFRLPRMREVSLEYHSLDGKRSMQLQTVPQHCDLIMCGHHINQWQSKHGDPRA